MLLGCILALLPADLQLDYAVGQQQRVAARAAAGKALLARARTAPFSAQRPARLSRAPPLSGTAFSCEEAVACS